MPSDVVPHFEMTWHVSFSIANEQIGLARTYGILSPELSRHFLVVGLGGDRTDALHENLDLLFGNLRWAFGYRLPSDYFNIIAYYLFCPVTHYYY